MASARPVGPFSPTRNTGTRKVFSSSNEHEGDYNVCVIAATKNAPYCPPLPPPPPIGNPGMMTVLCLHLRPIMPTAASG